MLQGPQLSDSALQGATSAAGTTTTVYIAVTLAAVFLNTADVYFLQSEKSPPLHRSPSFWLYLVGQAAIALLSAFLLLEKAKIDPSNWPIIAAASSLAGFSLLQSLTLKFGDKGIDARELFDTWKRRVIQDVTKANASRKSARIIQVSRALAKRVAGSTAPLEPVIHQLATSVQLDPLELINEFKKSRQDPTLMMAQWIAGTDLELAENLLATL